MPVRACCSQLTPHTYSGLGQPGQLVRRPRRRGSLDRLARTNFRRLNGYEIRNPNKSEKAISNDQNGWAAVSNFEPSNFELVSDFEFRVSDFKASWLGVRGHNLATHQSRLATAPPSDQSCPEAPRRGERSRRKDAGAQRRSMSSASASTASTICVSSSATRGSTRSSRWSPTTCNPAGRSPRRWWRCNAGGCAPPTSAASVTTPAACCRARRWRSKASIWRPRWCVQTPDSRSR